jgi:uncharacterized protein (DUF433 family)
MPFTVTGHAVGKSDYLRPLRNAGIPCIRTLRVTVGTIVDLIAAGRSNDEILQAYSYLEHEHLRAVLTYAAWRSEEQELPLTAG